MKFYVTKYRQYQDDGLPPKALIKWSGTQLDAAAKRKELLATSNVMPEIKTIDFEVPVDKPGLLAFLNEYLSGELKVIRPAEPNHLKKTPQTSQ